MTEHHLDTPDPVRLHVQVDRGTLTVDAVEDARTTEVVVAGKGADDVTVTQHDGEIRVAAPRRSGFLRGGEPLEVTVRLPAGSSLSSRTGSADVRVRGRLAELLVQTGSGEVAAESVEGAAEVSTGSGDVRLGDIGGTLQVKTGSGDLVIDRVGADATLASGSGDVHVRRCEAALLVRSGSGDLRVEHGGPESTLRSASGDLVVDCAQAGRLSLTTASGDQRVGVPSGLPVWTDISTVTGTLTSTLPPTGHPGPDQPYLELRASTVSGDVSLSEV